MHELETIIAIIKTGAPADVKAAQKRVAQLWRDTCGDPALRRGFSVFATEARTYDAISDIDHKLYFINTLKWPLWTNDLGNFQFWADFILARVQDPEGKVRLAAVRAAEYLAVEMLSCFDTPGGLQFKELSPDSRALVRRQFFAFAQKADELTRKYRTPALLKYKYISSLPPGIYKSC